MSGNLFAQWSVPFVILGMIVPAWFLLLWAGPTRNIFNYWLAQARGRHLFLFPVSSQCPSHAQPSSASSRYMLGFLGALSFYFFGPLAADKVNDPYDMNEAWQEFQFRAAVGLESPRRTRTATASWFSWSSTRPI